MSLHLDKSAWKQVAFGDVIESITERVDNPSEAGVDRYVGLEHLDPGVLTVQRWDSPDKVEAQKLRFSPGDVIFGRRRAYQKKVAMAEFEGICSAHALVLRAKPELVDPRFLPFFLASDYFLDQAISISVGSLSPTVNWRDLKVQRFVLPPLDEQKRLADLLWAVERQRSTLRRTSDSLDAARTSLFSERLQEGLETKNWQLKEVSSFVTDGPSNGKSARANDEGRGVPTLSISAVRDGRVLGGGSVKYLDIPAGSVTDFVLRENDFLVVRGNGNKQLTGRGGLVNGGLPEGCVYPDLLIRLRFDPDQILPGFAATQWNISRAHSALLQRAKSTNGIWKINGKDIKSHRLVVPPLGDQKQLLSELSQFDRAAEDIAMSESELFTLGRNLSNSIWRDA